MRLQRTSLFARLYHHQDIFFAHRFFLIFRPNAEQLQHKVGGEGQKTHERPAYAVHTPHDAHHLQGHSVRVFHGHALGHKLAQNQRKIRDDDSDDHQYHTAQHRSGQRQKRKQPRHRPRKIIRCYSRVQKTRQSYANLNCRKKI